jgi:glucose-6-phosphate dehydrogenase assembly protein OpcA
MPDVLIAHPARVFLLVGEAESAENDMQAEVSVWCQRHRGGPKVCSEQITLRARGTAVERLPFAVRSLLIGDLPTNLWWRATQPPPLAGALLHGLTEGIEQLVYDSIGWRDPVRCVAATAAWLEGFERGPSDGRWRVASDLNWRRLKFWRRLTAQALDPMTAPGALASITEVHVEHGPHAVVQAWLLVGWMATRLGWRVQSGRVEPGAELNWQVVASQGTVRITLRRLADGPSEVCRSRVKCRIEGKPTILNFHTTEENRLVVVPEGDSAAPRTITVQDQPLAELVARQLSDRERDPVFHESMAAAQVFAQSLLS